MGKIFVIGSMNMDLVITTEKIPIMGETVLGKSFMTAPGGKGANQAVAASKLGAEVLMAGCVGNDLFGKELLDNLKRYSVNIDNIKVIDRISTGIAVITVKEGNNSIIVAPGANYSITPEMIEEMECIISECSYVVMQLEIPLEIVEKVIKIAKKYDIKVVLNPAPALYLKDELINTVDILVMNEIETEIITGIEVNEIEDAEKAVNKLNNIGVGQVVITMGKRGAVYNNGNKVIHTNVPEVKVVDTTAAGDSFIGALVMELSEGKGIEEAVKYSNIVGTITVTKKGAQTSIPNKEEVTDFLNNI